MSTFGNREPSKAEALAKEASVPLERSRPTIPKSGIDDETIAVLILVDLEAAAELDKLPGREDNLRTPHGDGPEN